MFDGHRRWTLLGVLAAANLGLWVGVSCLVGLCAGDGVDLGVETLVRRVQATAVTSWSEAAGASGLSGGRLQQAVESVASPAVAMANDSADAPAEAASPGTAPLLPDQQGTPGAGGPAPVLEPSSLAVSGDGAPDTVPLQPEAQRSAGPPVAASPASAEPARATDGALNSPLLLVEPRFSSLTALDAEMERSATGRPVQIRYGEEALNQEIAALWLNNPGLPYRNVQVDLLHNGLAISGQVTVLGFQMDAHVEGNIVVQDCQPKLRVDSVSMAGVLVPRFVRSRVAAMAQEAMTWYPADYPLCLEQIVLEETRLTCYGYRR
jgi:hypothetical protein